MSARCVIPVNADAFGHPMPGAEHAAMHRVTPLDLGRGAVRAVAALHPDVERATRAGWRVVASFVHEIAIDVEVPREGGERWERDTKVVVGPALHFVMTLDPESVLAAAEARAEKAEAAMWAARGDQRKAEEAAKAAEARALADASDGVRAKEAHEEELAALRFAFGAEHVDAVLATARAERTARADRAEEVTS
jgi:hypothetical protein